MLEKKIVRLGISSSQYWILRLLWEQDFQIQKQLATSLNMKASSITGMIDVLEKKNLVIRKPDSVDKRAKIICLTGEGRSIQEKVKSLIHMNESTLLKGFSEEEAEQLKHLLKRVLHNLADYQLNEES